MAQTSPLAITNRHIFSSSFLFSRKKRSMHWYVYQQNSFIESNMLIKELLILVKFYQHVGSVVSISGLPSDYQEERERRLSYSSDHWSQKGPIYSTQIQHMVSKSSLKYLFIKVVHDVKIKLKLAALIKKSAVVSLSWRLF